MKKRDVTERRFKCTECNTVMTAYKSSARRTVEGHIKTMYCPWCKANRQFVQFRYEFILERN